MLSRWHKCQGARLVDEPLKTTTLAKYFSFTVPNKYSFLSGMFLLCLLLSGGMELYAQSPDVLKAKRQRLQKELRQTNQRLAATRARRGAAVGQADLIRQQIEQRTFCLDERSCVLFSLALEHRVEFVLRYPKRYGRSLAE